jgi:ribonuclease HI
MSEAITISAFIDGASKGNPGPAGWGVVLQTNGAIKHLAGAAHHATNNQMELRAAIEALKALRRPSAITLYTDSKLLSDAWNKWLDGWIEQGWQRSNGRPVQNRELWQELVELAKPHQVTIAWVKAHAGNPGNEQADRLASGAAEYTSRTSEVGPWARRVA